MKRHMKKLMSLLMTLVLVFALAGCGNTAQDNKTEEPADTENKADVAENAESGQDEGGAKSNEAVIAEIIIANGTIDDGSFNQGAWEGIKEYAEANNLSYQYYESAENTTDSQLEAIKLAVENGAKIVVAPGFNFETTIYQAQDIYPDTKFVLLDGEPHDEAYENYKTNDNVACIFYAEQEAGFLAGYALVKEGFRNLGFMGGMAYPAVMRYGYGYIAGADYAAKELGLQEGEVKINYTYTGNFEATPDNQTLAASWYQDGTEVIFACGGSVGYSVMAAAEQTDTYVVGVDTDQYRDSETVITSAEKMLANSVMQALTDWGNDDFKGGTTTTLDVTQDGVGIAMDTARFTKFTKADYDEIYQMLVNDTDGIRSAIPNDTVAESADGVPADIVKVTVANN